MKPKLLLPLLMLLFFLSSCSKDETGNDKDNQNSENDNVTQNQKVTGSSSNDLLSDSTFKSMVIEVVYVAGYKPTESAVNDFVAFLNARVNKPNGITIEKKEIASPGQSKYTIQDIIAIEDTNRTQYNTDNKIAVWAFFVDGESSKNTDSGTVLGTAYRNTSFVIFEETIHDLSNSAFEPDRDVLETTVITHEFGHILGLTNLGADMVTAHEDTQHKKHCNDESCLMYWAAETGDGLSNLIGASAPPQLDAHCISDLQANGGK